MADEAYAHHHRKEEEEEDVELKREEKIKEESLKENEKRKYQEEQAKEVAAKVAEVSSPAVVVVRSRGIAGLPTFCEFHVKECAYLSLQFFVWVRISSFHFWSLLILCFDLFFLQRCGQMASCLIHSIPFHEIIPKGSHHFHWSFVFLVTGLR